MREIARSVITNDFRGCSGHSVYRLMNGQIWQQVRYRYQYLYAYRPEARIIEANGSYLLEVAGLSEPVVVRRASLVEDGVIVSPFTGFKRDSEFVFQSGRRYVPVEHKHLNHHAHRPEAMIIDGSNGLELIVDDVDEHLRVRRA